MADVLHLNFEVEVELEVSTDDLRSEIVTELEQSTDLLAEGSSFTVPVTVDVIAVSIVGE